MVEIAKIIRGVETIKLSVSATFLINENNQNQNKLQKLDRLHHQFRQM